MTSVLDEAGMPWTWCYEVLPSKQSSVIRLQSHNKHPDTLSNLNLLGPFQGGGWDSCGAGDLFSMAQGCQKWVSNNILTHNTHFFILKTQNPHIHPNFYEVLNFKQFDTPNPPVN